MPAARRRTTIGELFIIPQRIRGESSHRQAGTAIAIG
jgi:hypothetical protein